MKWTAVLACFAAASFATRLKGTTTKRRTQVSGPTAVPVTPGRHTPLRIDKLTGQESIGAITIPQEWLDRIPAAVEADLAERLAKEPPGDGMTTRDLGRVPINWDGFINESSPGHGFNDTLEQP